MIRPSVSEPSSNQLERLSRCLSHINYTIEPVENLFHRKRLSGIDTYHCCLQSNRYLDHDWFSPQSGQGRKTSIYEIVIPLWKITGLSRVIQCHSSMSCGIYYFDPPQSDRAFEALTFHKETTYPYVSHIPLSLLLL